MPVCTLDPLTDARWPEFARGHPCGTPFHTREWVTALRETYAYEPIVYTTSPPGAPLANGILVCRVRSWLTGSRLVSVPFADHCEPLVDRPEDALELALALRERTAGEWRYIELRPVRQGPWTAAGLTPAASFRAHIVSLARPAQGIFQSFHPSTIQRKIRRAEREGVRYEEGNSNRLLGEFYRLMLLTRRRHGVPPQPMEWFANLARAFGDRLKIGAALHGGRPAAAMVTLRHGPSLVYKYGCSDARLHHLGVMPYLFWLTIQGAQAAGVETFDLGRSDLNNPGLITFKERLGASSSTLTYLRSPAPSQRTTSRTLRVAGRLLAFTPDFLFTRAGRLLYPHLA
jgi:CelD/BcsL family acetyltransferase involved in cellulose biosynthesis